MKRNSCISLLTAAVMTCAAFLTGCSDSSDSSNKSENTDSKAKVIETSDNGSINKDLTANELVHLMGNGINLGNTMEAYGHKNYSTDTDPTSFETLWGQPVTTQEMIDGMKASGFDSLRVPVAWTNAMDYESGDYTINEAYLDRIEEIINYGLNADMYVIINDHWDGSWWGMFGSSEESDREKAMDMYVSMWTQIAERYKKYSDRLIFESANEELGDRLNDTDVCSNSGALSQQECYDKTNEINQKFVDTIRSTGGNNEQRFLLIAGYNTDITMTCRKSFKMPTDTAKSKLLLSVHYYTPWDYCGTKGRSHWGTQSDYQEQDRLFKMMTRYSEEGYGIIIGEYAVLTNGGDVKADTDKFFENLLDNCDAYNFCPMLWDCSDFFSRNQLAMRDDTIAEIFQRRSFSSQSSMSQEEEAAAAAKRIEETLAAAPEKLTDDTATQADENTAVAWIMYQSSDYSVVYSVGDDYDPASKSDGVVADNAVIDGEGTYTVKLDMSGNKARGFAFSALGIANGEKLYPDYIATIDEIKINDEPVDFIADGYTCSDDGLCTRVNIYNQWVNAVPDDGRIEGGDLSNAAPVIIDYSGSVSTMEVTFTYKAK